MKTKVWILNHYASDTFFDKGGRHYSISKYLKRAGYEPTIFCCNSKHSSNKELYFQNNRLYHEHIAEEINVPYIFVRGRPYTGNGIQRVLNMLDFFFNVQIACRFVAKKNGKPDVIIGSSVHPLACVAAINLSKSFKCRNVVEIRDLWPESIVAYGVASKNNILVKLLYRLEKWIYSKADVIIFTMEGGRDYIIEKGWDTEHGGPVDLKKVYHINNGVDLEEYDYNKEHHTINDPDLENRNVFKVVYTGSIRKVNDVGLLLDAMKQVATIPIKLLIWGRGDETENLKKRVFEEHIDNVVFKGNADKVQVPFILSKSDACLLHWRTTPISRYGMSMNKQFEYLDSGKPVLSTVKAEYSVLDNMQCGLTAEEYSVESIAEILNEIYCMSENQRIQLGKRAREAGEEYSFNALTDKLLDILGEHL